MTQQLTPESALALAVKIVGSQAKMAKLCGVAQPTVWKWLNIKSRILPAEHVLPIEAATGISRHDLRPDIYPRELSGTLPGGASPAVSGISPVGDAASTGASAGASAHIDPLSGLVA